MDIKVARKVLFSLHSVYSVFFPLPPLQIWCILSTTNIIFCVNIPYILCTLWTCMPYIPCNVHSEYSKYFLCMCNILSKLIQNAICHIALPRIITIVSFIPIIVENIEKSQGSQFWSKFYKLYLTYHINWHKSIPCFTSFSPLGIKWHHNSHQIRVVFKQHDSHSVKVDHTVQGKHMFLAWNHITLHISDEIISQFTSQMELHHNLYRIKGDCIVQGK